MTKATKTTAADQNIPTEYLNPENGNFLVGADARCKADAIYFLTTNEHHPDCWAELDTETATAIIEARGWESHLAKRIQKIKDDAAKAAGAQERKAQRAKQRAEMKAKAIANAAQRKAEREEATA